ncbi:MaoC domain protein dehydratase [Actinokineospora spheciospongiae]|uniref:MaoC domain protein dehydratase n=1 Tax=Actinokineospora spheciospongiae TaxID=909613 RepID=W7JD49_9PSEU|nr:MaoC/PaaZ C-terminal domain-containing protein [Actinokineospora spheciospongiae]EWC63929.1 MaoC domain protein dehydratase [Actinokineospora spheciospongiae]
MPDFTTAALGEWTEPETFEVTAERIAAYAEATNDPIPAHRAGEVAPPVFGIVPVFRALGPAAFAVAPLELVPFLVHGEHDFTFHRPIRPGDVLTSRARPIGVVSRERGTAVVVHTETRAADGEPVNEQWMTSYFRGVDGGVTEGERAPGHAFDESLRAAEPTATVAAHLDDDQTHRYSPAAGDPMPIHLDPEMARSVGLPGIIVHGMCTMAMTSWAALTAFADGDTARLRRLAVRFAKPVLPGQDISTAFHATGTGHIFETTVGDTVVIKDGLAVLG